MNQRGHPLRGIVRRRPRLFGLYGPFLGAGIRVQHVSPTLDRIRVRMPLRWWNQNLLGTHFGGSLYAMCDPIFLWMLRSNSVLATSCGTRRPRSASVGPGAGR